MSIYLDPITHPDAWNRLAFPTAQLVTPGKCRVNAWTRDNEYDVKVGKGTQGATETLKGQPPAKGSITFWAWIPEHFSRWDAVLDLLRFDPAKYASALTANNAGAAPTGSKGQTFGQAPTRNAADGTGGSTGAGEVNSTVGDTSAQAGGTPGAFTSPQQQPTLSKAFAIEVFHPALADINVSYVLPPEKIGSWEEDGEGSGLYKREIEFLEWTQPNNKNIAATPTGADAKNPGGQYAGAPVKSAAEESNSATQQAASGAQGAHGL